VFFQFSINGWYFLCGTKNIQTIIYYYSTEGLDEDSDEYLEVAKDRNLLDPFPIYQPND
jgi:hypothetical protein